MICKDCKSYKIDGAYSLIKRTTCYTIVIFIRKFWNKTTT